MSSLQNTHRAGNTDGSWREERANLDKIRVNWPRIDFSRVVFQTNRCCGRNMSAEAKPSLKQVLDQTSPIPPAPSSFSDRKWKLPVCVSCVVTSSMLRAVIGTCGVEPFTFQEGNIWIYYYYYYILRNWLCTLPMPHSYKIRQTLK